MNNTLTVTTAKTLAAAAALSLGCAAAVPANADTQVVFGQYSRPQQPLNARGIIPFLEAVEEQSGGAIDTTFAGGGAVVTAKTTLFALRDGLVDGAFVPTVYYPAELPVVNVIVNLGVVMSDVKAAIGAINEVMLLDCPACNEEAKRWNMRFLGAWSLTPYDLMCTQPVRTAADVEGLRIRAAGHTVPLTTALGASPINVPSSEIYEVLERGQVDCVFGPPNWLEANSLGEIAKHVVDVNAGTVPNPNTLMLREEVWEAMSADEQALLVEHAPAAIAGAYFGTLEEDEAALNKEGAGYELITPDASLKAAIEEAAADAFETAVAKGEEQGVDGARTLAQKVMTAYERWQGLVADVDSEEAYAKLLSDEVFAKYTPGS
ncbi:C4-dicarboxylate TRAP transporter substrate-binding protein [Acuticoccus sp.]|uniref:C4-dicarboxylate TRAP transporter substrate-binding protein n=1 Tax=Acuticoccus sp. TaxID=1904378 RepID=UPI003B521DE0